MDVDQALSPRSVRAISWRSVLLGLSGVLLINILVPYNDYVLFNTFLVGNSLPLGAVVLVFLLAVLVNGPLSYWKPKHALGAGELGVVMMMLLVGSAIPSSALMRHLPGSLVYPFTLAQSNAELSGILDRLNLPAWLYPVFEKALPSEWGQDPVATGFVGRWTGEGPPPYWAWVRPALVWGIYLVGFHGAVLCLMVLVRRQWYENERLSFPLARIELALLEPPAPGRWFGGVLGRRSFWLTLLAINLLHGFNALSVYQPMYFPEIPVGYKLQGLFGDPPWRYMGWWLQGANVVFTAVGVAYLMPGSISFSLWFFTVAYGFWSMIQGSFTGDGSVSGAPDQATGGMLAYVAIVLWIGRRHWWVIFKQALRGARGGEPEGRYMSYAWAFWGLVGSWALMCGWLVAAGTTLGGAVVITSALLVGFFFMARVVAETGLLHPGTITSPGRAWEILSMYGFGQTVPVKTFWLASHLHLLHYDARESFGVYASHGLKVTDQTVFEGGASASGQSPSRSTGLKLLGLMALTLVVAYAASFSSMIWVEYRYAYEKQIENPQPVNAHVALSAPAGIMVNPTLNYDKQNYNPTHSPMGHLTGGALGTLFLSMMRLRYVWWPFHPIGYLFMSTWPMSQLWFSIMIGWGVRGLALRFGGASFYMRLQPIMMGLIIGEAVASGIWLVLGFALSTMGYDYYPIRFTLH